MQIIYAETHWDFEPFLKPHRRKVRLLNNLFMYCPRPHTRGGQTRHYVTARFATVGMVAMTRSQNTSVIKHRIIRYHLN